MLTGVAGRTIKMYDFREDLKRRYRKNIQSAKDELKTHFQEIRRLNHLIKENEVCLRSLSCCQLSIEDLLNDEKELKNV